MHISNCLAIFSYLNKGREKFQYIKRGRELKSLGSPDIGHRRTYMGSLLAKRCLKMSRYQHNASKNPLPDDCRPARKRPRIFSSSIDNCTKAIQEDDDPFADDDVTGEELKEWEFFASQAEMKLTQEQSKVQTTQVNGHHQNGTGNSSFKIPPRKTSHIITNQKNSDFVEELKNKVTVCENQIKELEQSYKMKDGETLILRDRLSKAEKDLTQQKLKVVEVQKRYDNAEVEHDKKLQKELERYKDQVQFKQAEIMESQNLIKNLETKYKILEQQKYSGTSDNILNNTKNGFHDTMWTNSQSESGTSAPKKIRLVKPESPRVQNSHLLNKASFSDDPLGRKQPMKSSPNKHSSEISSYSADEVSLTKTRSPTHSKRLSKLKLKSKYLSNESSSGQMLLRNILSKTDEAHSNTSHHSFMNLLIRKNRKSASLQSLHRMMLKNNKSQNKVFGNLCQLRHNEINDVSDMNDEFEILSLISDIFISYINLQESLTGNRMNSQDTSSYHTAPLEQPASTAIIPHCTSNAHSNNRSSISKDTDAALQVLHILVTNSHKIRDFLLNQSSDILTNLLAMCRTERWNLNLEHRECISSTALSIVNILAKSIIADMSITRFTTTLKPEVMAPLITHQNIDIKLNSLDVIITLSHHPSYALSIVKEEQQSDTPSILCHICDICCTVRPQTVIEGDWLILLTKVMTLLSILISEHESLLVDHSCYSEIYRAADVLLYNQLVTWKKERSNCLKRVNLIQKALCLLHSCANVYTDAIPGSRRDHRHQLVLTNLEEFLNINGDRTSFWSQELNRIVKLEVSAIFEDVDIT
ncbi:uncharacterized protein LOC120328126 isoform X1 [Styela clava]